LKKGSDPLEGVEEQGKTGRPERVRPLFQRAANPLPRSQFDLSSTSLAEERGLSC
jgi:hypothetical protein